MVREADLPDGEHQRLAALKRYNILDTEPEMAFDLVTQFVSEELNAPISLVSLVDSDRQWFKSRVGLSERQTSRSIAFCAHAILSDDVLVVEDATKDCRFCDSPLVLGDPRIRSYAGAPLISPEGFRLGTLCAIHQEVTPLNPTQVSLLKTLASWTVSILEHKTWDTPPKTSG